MKDFLGDGREKSSQIKVIQCKRASLVPHRLKHLPAMQKTQVQLLGPEDPLEEEMATQSSILAWRIPWTADPGGLQSMGSQSQPDSGVRKDEWEIRLEKLGP